MSAGAIDAENGAYIPPALASKDRVYICADCRARVVFRKGEVRIPHFAHWSGAGCGYYEHPSESQIHKDAKLRLTEILKNKKEINLGWSCGAERCQAGGHGDETFRCEEGDEVITEYRGPNGAWVADVAVLTDKKVKCIFEVRHTHKTTTSRPEPWYEIDAREIIKEEDCYYTCLRRRLCYGCETLRQPWMDGVPRLYKRIGASGDWKQRLPCICCTRDKYSPVFLQGYRALCKICLDEDQSKLQALLTVNRRALLDDD